MPALKDNLAFKRDMATPTKQAGVAWENIVLGASSGATMILGAYLGPVNIHSPGNVHTVYWNLDAVNVIDLSYAQGFCGFYSYIEPAPVSRESRNPEEEQLKARILEFVRAHPRLDDEEIGDELGIAPVEASRLLRDLEAEGSIRRI